ncbi:hypothetical protein C8Q70DRAFT_544464 [Cubamyces menziesii]|nr:hypothetical protein C8Q70DRAFT_544464 [Cubamyces menziesii]
MPSDSESIQTSQASECFLLGLAEELLISILLELGPADLLSCTNVCRVIAEVIEQTPAVQYKLQLGLSGMVDGPAGVAPLGKRLERLRAYRAASLQCKADVKVVSMPDCCNLWRLTDCVFAFERRGIVRMVRFASSFTGITEGDIGHLDCTKSITDPGFSICDCVIDRAQDLAILTHVNGNEYVSNCLLEQDCTKTILVENRSCSSSPSLKEALSILLQISHA